jgi:hypothetical protein
VPRKRPYTDSRIVIFVSDERAARDARRVARQLSRPKRVRVRFVSPRFRLQVMKAINRELINTSPRSMWGTIGLMGFMEIRGSDNRCPRVQISVQRKSQSTAEVERWLANAASQYGADRIQIRRTDGGPVPAVLRRRVPSP